MCSKRSDPAMGLKVMTLAGPMADRRLRCLGMTDEERRWRAQFLKDQILSPDEPRDVPEYYKATTNCFRRLWKTPFWKLQQALTPSLGRDAAFVLRHTIGVLGCGIAVTFVTVYYFKYHTNDFTISRPVEFFKIRPAMYPDHPDYPNYPAYSTKKPSDYYDQGFYSSVLCQDVEIEEPPPPPPPPPTEEESKCPALEEKEN